MQSNVEEMKKYRSILSESNLYRKNKKYFLMTDQGGGGDMFASESAFVAKSIVLLLEELIDVGRDLEIVEQYLPEVIQKSQIVSEGEFIYGSHIETASVKIAILRDVSPDQLLTIDHIVKIREEVERITTDRTDSKKMWDKEDQRDFGF